MCGINGELSYLGPASIDNLSRMNNAISHRGPDGEGTFVSFDGSVALGNRRLSIVDIKRGAQPIVYEQNGTTYSITFNGQIYNHLDLRRELERNGHQFKTKSDTEVLLKSYLEWGKDCLGKLNGAFAFAIYDGKEKKLFLARDRLGIKPLYYAKTNHSFLFSSEPKGILARTDVEKVPDHEIIANYFVAMMTLANCGAPPERSFYKEISALPSGTYAFVDERGLQSLQRYWHLPFPQEIPEQRLRGTEAVEALRSALEEAVRLRIPHEVGFGTALSGCLDSSIVTVLALQYVDKLTSATIGFLDDPDYQHAKLLADQRGIRLLSPELTAEEMITGIDELVQAYDEPHNTIRQLGLMNVFKVLRDEGFKVGLVGEGSDEALLGYFNNSPGFASDGAYQNPEILRKALISRARFSKRYFSDSFLSQIDLESVAENIFLQEYDDCQSEFLIDKMTNWYFKRFLTGYRLLANDRSGMHYGLEVRTPFCDHNVIRVALSIAPSFNLQNGTEKHALREAFRGQLPEEIYHREKYALPESRNLHFYDLMGKRLGEEIESASPEVWEIVSRDYTCKISQNFATRIQEIREGRDNDLTQNIALNQEVSMRVKHVFSILTFLRWFDMNF